jgi:hypothetical protein
VQFMLNNLIGIPPMLVLGGMADAIGIPRVMEIVGLIALAMAGVSVAIQRAPRKPTLDPTYPDETPLPGPGILTAATPEEAP